MSEKKRFETREQPEAENFEVGENEWKIVTPPNTIETTGLGPCVGIIVYDPELKKAMCGHYVWPEIGLDEMLDEAIKIFPDKSRLKIYVGGRNPRDDDPPYTFTKAKREYVKQSLASHGFQNSQISIKWSDSSRESTVMRIDPGMGDVEYDQKEDYGDEDND